MFCRGCGNKEATRVRSRYVEGKLQEKCDGCGNVRGSASAKKTGFMFGNKLLKRNSNKDLAKQVRQEYIGTDHDEVRGKDW